VIIMADQIEDGINRCKKLVKEMNDSINPVMDHERFLADCKIHKAIAENRLDVCKYCFDKLEGLRVYTEDEEREMGVISCEMSEHTKRLKLLHGLLIQSNPENITGDWNG